jgi:hypothetical protein
MRPKRYESPLTPKGFDLYPIVMAIVHWGDIHRVDERGRPRRYEHKLWDKVFDPVMNCSECQQPLSARGVHVHVSPGANEGNSLAKWRLERGLLNRGWTASERNVQ